MEKSASKLQFRRSLPFMANGQSTNDHSKNGSSWARQSQNSVKELHGIDDRKKKRKENSNEKEAHEAPTSNRLESRENIFTRFRMRLLEGRQSVLN